MGILGMPKWVVYTLHMASVRRKTGTRYWIACYTDASGRQRQKSAKTTSRSAALKMAELLEQGYRKNLNTDQFRDSYAQVLREVHGVADERVTVADYAEQWLAKKQLETSANTRSSYGNYVRCFLAFLGDRKNMLLANLTVDDFSRFREVSAKEVSRITANNRLKCLRVMMQDAFREDRVRRNCAKLVRTLKRAPGASTRRPFTLDEIKAVYAAANPEWKRLIAFGLYTGQRLGDLARLTWRNLDLQTQVMAISTHKTDRRVIIPLAAPLLELIQACQGTDGPDAPVFPRAHGIIQAHGKVSQLSREFIDILIAAGLRQDVPTHRAYVGKGRSVARIINSLTFHCLRHTLTSMLKNANVGESVAMDIVGHESKAISQVYTHMETDTKRAAIGRLPNIL
jgi:integrase